MRARWQAAIASALMVVTMAALAATLVVGTGGIDDRGYASVVVFSGSFTALGLVGGLLVVKRQGNLLGWLLLASGLCTVLALAAASYVDRRPDEPIALYLLVVAALWIPGAVAGLVLVPLTFPTGRPPTPRWRWVAWLGVAAAGAMLADILVAVVRYPELLVLGWEAYDEVTDGGLLARVADLSWPALLVAGILAWASVAVRFRRSRGAERQQVKWFVLAMGVMVAYVVFTNSAAAMALPWLDVVFGAVALPSIPVAIGVAVLRYRLYEIDRVVSRTVSYALLTALLAGVYLAAVLALPRLLAPLRAGSELTVAVGTLAAAALFAPARRRIQHAVDRRFNRARYDAEQIVAAFRERLRGQVELADVVAATRAAAVGTVEPARASLWLRTGETRR